jgi:hypothetical protein
MSFPGEIRSRNEYAFIGVLPMQSSGKFLDLRTSNRCCPTLRLEIDDFQTESIFFNYAI